MIQNFIFIKVTNTVLATGSESEQPKKSSSNSNKFESGKLRTLRVHHLQVVLFAWYWMLNAALSINEILFY